MQATRENAREWDRDAGLERVQNNKENQFRSKEVPRPVMFVGRGPCLRFNADNRVGLVGLGRLDELSWRADLIITCIW